MSNFKHNSAIDLANSVLSTTDSPSVTKRDEEFLRLTTEYSYSEPGNIIPRFWFKEIVDEKGRPDHTAIILLSEVLTLYRFSNSTARCSYIDKLADNKTTLVGKVLRTSYEHFSEKFMIRKEKARRGFLRLEELGIIERGVCNISLDEGGRCNKLMITIDQEFFLSCFRDPKKDIRALKNRTLSTSKDEEVKKSSSPKPITAGNNRNNPICSNSGKFQSLQISYHHISNKRNIIIKRIRSINYASYEATSESNFLKNNLGLKEIDTYNLLEIRPGEVEKNTELVEAQLGKQAFEPSEEKAIIDIKPNIFSKPRKLSDFYPLCAEDCKHLQSLSGREFNLNAMNEILLDMSKRLTRPLFKSKKGFLSYMSIAFKNEMRDANKINNETFRIKANLSSEEIKEQEAEKYLTNLENSCEVSPEMHLKKKLGSVFHKLKAVELLKSYKSLTITGDTAKLKLYGAIDLSPLELEIILNQIKASHESFKDGVFIPIEKLEVIITERKPKNPKPNNIKQIPDTIWGNIRRSLIAYYEDGIDTAWFSKLEATEDSCSKEINLKFPTEFFKSYIKNNYESTIDRIAETMGFKIKGLQ
jgi:hypothetical protein